MQASCAVIKGRDAAGFCLVECVSYALLRHGQQVYCLSNNNIATTTTPPAKPIANKETTKFLIRCRCWSRSKFGNKILPANRNMKRMLCRGRGQSINDLQHSGYAMETKEPACAKKGRGLARLINNAFNILAPGLDVLSSEVMTAQTTARVRANLRVRSA